MLKNLRKGTSEMTDAQTRQPGDVARKLGISTSTLRRWAGEFDNHLSRPASKPSRTGVGAAAPRRYTEADVAFLAKVKALLDQGMSLDQVVQRLKGEPGGVTRGDGRGEETYPLVASEAEMEAPAFGRSFVIVADALRSINENQQALQNSLQVNRNLLGVLIQDNFNLKEENSKLRDRVLKLEQAIGQLRQDELASPLSKSQLDELESRRGCLGIASR